MTKNDKIRNAIYAAIDEVNEMSTEDAVMEKSPDATLFGAGAVFDSIALVNLLVTVEREVFDALDVSITIADERLFSREKSPFRSVAAFTEYVQDLVEEAPA